MRACLFFLLTLLFRTLLLRHAQKSNFWMFLYEKMTYLLRLFGFLNFFLTCPFVSNDVISYRFMLACWIPLYSHFVAVLSVALLSCTFYPSVEAKCTLGVCVCSFSRLLLIQAFKRRFRVVFWCIQYRINLHSQVFRGVFQRIIHICCS